MERRPSNNCVRLSHSAVFQIFSHRNNFFSKFRGFGGRHLIFEIQEDLAHPHAGFLKWVHLLWHMERHSNSSEAYTGTHHHSMKWHGISSKPKVIPSPSCMPEEYKEKQKSCHTSELKRKRKYSSFCSETKKGREGENVAKVLPQFSSFSKRKVWSALYYFSLFFK